MSIFYQEWAGGSFNNDGWWSWQEGNQQDCREIYWRNWQVRGESIMDLWFKLIKSDDLFLYLRMIWFLSMNLSRWWTSVMLKRKCQWSLEDNCRFLAPSLCIHNKRKYKFEFLFKLLRATIISVSMPLVSDYIPLISGWLIAWNHNAPLVIEMKKDDNSDNLTNYCIILSQTLHCGIFDLRTLF